MNTVLTISTGALLFAALALFIRVTSIWVVDWRYAAQIKKHGRQRSWLLASHTRKDIDTVGMLACEQAAHGASFANIQLALLGKGWPKPVVAQIAYDAPVAAAQMAGILVASGALLQICMKELQERPHFTPAIIRLAMFCAARAHPGSIVSAELGGGSDYEWKYYSACTSLAA